MAILKLPKVRWPEPGCWVNYGGQEEEEFSNGCDDYFITQIIDRSTFGVNGMGGNTLDLILTSDPERILETNYFPPLGSIKVGHAVIGITLGMFLENENELKPNKRDELKANF